MKKLFIFTVSVLLNVVNQFSLLASMDSLSIGSSPCSLSLEELGGQARYDRLKVYNKWHLKDLYTSIRPHIHHVYSLLSGVPNAMLFYIIGHHTHEQQEATVRFVAQDVLCNAEQLFLQQRSRTTHQGLESFLGITINPDKQPRIALCFSGGGFRAMLLSLGFLVGAHDSGLLDSTTYMAGLSGSTWILAPWVATKTDLHTWRNNLGKKISRGIHHLKHHADRKVIAKQLLTKLWFKQSVSAMDIYGPLLANTLLPELDDKKFVTTISDSHEHVIQGRYPMPIYAAISTNVEPYEWFEVTPFELGAESLGAYIPLWAYGRKFKHGKTVDFAPEQSLAYFMGIFGSAFEVDIEDAIRLSAETIKEFKEEIPVVFHAALDAAIEKLVNSPLDDIRLAPSMMPNFMYKTGHSHVSDQKRLSLVDGGIDFNLPLPLLLRTARDIDVIVVYDSSAGEVGSELRHAADYAKRKGIKFPPVPESLGQELCTVLKDPHNDPKCPTIIYMPRIKNESYSATFDPSYCIEHQYCGTLNFKYSQKQINELSGLAECACHQYIDVIKNEVMARLALK